MPSATSAAEIQASCFTVAESALNPRRSARPTTHPTRTLRVAQGAAVIALTNPLDCLKQRWQVEPPGGKRSLGAFALSIIRDEGLVRGLWAPGIALNMCACTISVGTRLGMYPMVRDRLQPAASTSRLQRGGVGMFLSGLLGGALGYMAGSPFFYAARVAHAEAGTLAADGLLYTTGARKGKPPTVPGGSGYGLAMLTQLAATGGVLSLWRGADLLVARGALMSATQLATYDLSKGHLKVL